MRKCLLFLPLFRSIGVFPSFIPVSSRRHPVLEGTVRGLLVAKEVEFFLFWEFFWGLGGKDKLFLCSWGVESTQQGLSS